MKKNEELRDLDVGKLVILESEQWGVFLKDNQIREQKEDLLLAAPWSYSIYINVKVNEITGQWPGEQSLPVNTLFLPGGKWAGCVLNNNNPE